MFCNKCGNQVATNQQYCNKCGNQLSYNNIQNETMSYNNIFDSPNYNINDNYGKKTRNTIILIVVISIFAILILGLVTILYFIIFNNTNKYYFYNEIAGNTVEKETIQEPSTKTTTKGKYKTAIITDNIYTGISIKSIADANKLIVQDSVNQKQSDYPKEIMQVENNIIQKYSITAVNLKEMDVEFAKELENVIKNIYENYPSARGYLTNLTLTNLDMSEASVIALFRPIFMFGTSNTNTTRPWVIKTQVQLNAKYFLNPERIDVTVKTSSKSGHFPENATKYSPVAHEFGHYLSFIALLNYYNTDSLVVVEDNGVQDYYDIFRDFGNCTISKKMLDEAYQNYIKDNEKIGFDEWRGQISQYALAKDNSGNYIYDETIAEAFHDVYLNGKNAKQPSKYIVEVLKKYIER